MAEHLNPTDLPILVPRVTPQWLAGFFDGEGCVNARRTNDNENTSVRVMITQSDPLLLSLIMVKFPPSSFGPMNHKLKNGKGITVTWCATWYGTKCVPILEYIKDHVILKDRQVKLGLEFCSLVGSPGFRSGNTVAGLARREEIVTELNKLNAREQNYIPN